MLRARPARTLTRPRHTRTLLPHTRPLPSRTRFIAWMDGHEACAEGIGQPTAPPAPSTSTIPSSPLPPGFAGVLLVQAGVGSDQHGQDSTKAAVRAAKDAITYNALSLRRLLPGGASSMRVHVRIAVPRPDSVDRAAVAAVFPYGTLSPVEVVDGGMAVPTFVPLAEHGDTNDLMTIAVAAVTVGYGGGGGAVGGGGGAEVPSHAGYCE